MAPYYAWPVNIDFVFCFVATFDFFMKCLINCLIIFYKNYYIFCYDFIDHNKI
jgi:hypothetical protein